MTRSLLFSYLIALCVLAVQPLEVRAEDAPELPQYATKAIRFSHPNCGDLGFPSALTPDSLLATGCDDGSVQLLNPITGEILWQSPPDSPNLKHFAFPDTNTLMTITADNKAVLYDLMSRKERARYTLPITSTIYDVRASAGRILVLASAHGEEIFNKKPWTLTAISAADGKVIAERTLSEEPGSFTLSPDGTQTAWIGTITDGTPDERTLRWVQTDMLGGADVQTSFCDFNEDILYLDQSVLTFSPDNKTLAAGFGRALCVHTLDGSSRDRIIVRPEDDPEFYYLEFYDPVAVRFSADGQHISVIDSFRQSTRTTSYFRNMATYYVAVSSGKKLSKPPSPSTLWGHDPVAAHILGLGPVAIFRSNPVQFERKYPSEGGINQYPALVKAGLNVGEFDSVMRLPFLTLDEKNSGESTYRIWISPDGRWLAASNQMKVLVWDTAKGPTTRPFQIESATEEDWLVRPFFSADSAHLITASKQHIIRWDLATHTATRDKINVDERLRIDFIYPSTDPDTVLLCINGHFMRFGFETKKMVKDAGFPVLDACPDVVATSVESQRLLSQRTEEDSYAAFLELHKGKESTVIESSPKFSLDTWRYATLSKDGQTIALPSDKSVKVIHADTNTLLGTIAVAFSYSFPVISPDGQWLATSVDAEGEPITLLHIPSQKIVKLTPGSALSNRALTFSADSKTLISLHSRDRIFYWDINAIIPTNK